MPSAQLSCFDTTTGWWAECLGVGFVVGRRLIEGGAAPCGTYLWYTCGNRFPGNFPEF